MDTKELLKWVRSQLHTATVDDITKDFCDGTVLMELAVLLVNDETSVSDALEKFTEKPTTMFESLENIKSVLRCLGTDVCGIKPLDVFRGRIDVILELLQWLRSKYDGLLKPMSAKGSLSKQDINDWAKTVCEHTDSLRKESGESPNILSDHSDHDTGFIDHTGSAGSDIGDNKHDIATDKSETRFSEDYGTNSHISNELPELRPQDESYSSVDIIEVEEQLVRADSKIILSSGSNRRACVYVSIPMRYEVTDMVARDSFLNQATRNYILSGCELPLNDLQKLGLGYAILLATCSYARSLRTQSVGIYSPFLLGLQTINIAEKRQLFAHVLRNRVILSAQQKPEHVKLNMKNISKVKIQLIIPEGAVWQQQDLNGDSHVVTKEGVVRTLYPEETEIISIPALYLNKHGGKCRSQPLSLTPFVFRGPLTDQEKLFNYSDPGDKGYFRFCTDCSGVIHTDMYGVVYHENKPYHVECGPACYKCGLNCLTVHLKENKPYCSLECYYLSRPSVGYCEKCGYVLTDTDTNTHHVCPKPCKICEILCFDVTQVPPLCSPLCQDWDGSKSSICQGCAHPVTKKSTSQVIDKMLFHSVNCFKIRTTAPPLILQRAMVRGRDCEVTELRRLTKIEFSKRSERRRDALRLRKEERERSYKLDNVMDCINKIEAHSGSTRKYATQPRKTKPQKFPSNNNIIMSRDRSRSLSSGDSKKTVDSSSRKRANVKQPDSISVTSYASSIASRRSNSETGSFLDLLFSSDDEKHSDTRPCRQFSRSLSDNMSKPLRIPINYEKKKLNRGFPTGEKQSRELPKTRQRTKSADSDNSMNSVQIVSTGPAFNRSSKRFQSLRRSTSKGSTGSTSSSTSISPTPRVEFERPDLFLQLRCEKQNYTEDRVNRFGRHQSAPGTSREYSRVPDIVPTLRHKNGDKILYQRFDSSEKQRNISPNEYKRSSKEYSNQYKCLSPTKQNFSPSDRSASPSNKDSDRTRCDSRSQSSDSAVHYSVSEKYQTCATKTSHGTIEITPTTFQRLLTSPSTSSTRITPMSSPFSSPSKSGGTDPLSHYAGLSPSRPIQKSATSITDAQFRYERRFNRNRSKNGGSQSNEKNTVMNTCPEDMNPSPFLEPNLDKKYSLELLKISSEDLRNSNHYTSPRLHNEEHAGNNKITNANTLPGTTEPLVGLRLSSGHTISVEDISFNMINLNDRRKSAQTVI